MTAFTHDFKLKYNAQNIEGEIEFNEDDEVSYEYANTPTFELKEAKLIHDLFLVLKEIFKLGGNIKKINIVEK